jgi:hypothetical protein
VRNSIGQLFKNADNDGPKSHPATYQQPEQQSSPIKKETDMSLSTQPPGGLPQAAIELLGRARAQRQNAYRLRWKGTNIPRGASVTINGQLFMIFATQNGFVMAYIDGHGKELGLYVRESNGEDGTYSMIIATDGEVHPGVDQTAELLRDFPLEAPGI